MSECIKQAGPQCPACRRTQINPLANVTRYRWECQHLDQLGPYDIAATSGPLQKNEPDRSIK